jgi:uncharacterized membrane-anchored protein YitT (DUF2179 family)
VPNNIIDGGVVGISIMASFMTKIPLSVFIVVLNLKDRINLQVLGHLSSRVLN